MTAFQINYKDLLDPTPFRFKQQQQKKNIINRAQLPQTN